MPSFMCVTYKWWAKWQTGKGPRMFKVDWWRERPVMLLATTLSNKPPEAIFWVYGSFFKISVTYPQYKRHYYKCYAVVHSVWIVWNCTACSQETQFKKGGIERHVDSEDIEGSSFTSVTKEGDVSTGLGIWHSSRGTEDGRESSSEVSGTRSWRSCRKSRQRSQKEFLKSQCLWIMLAE